MKEMARTLLAAGWFRLARSTDVGRSVLALTVAHGARSGTVLLWRTRFGRVVAMDGRCPHQHYPMHDAQLVGNTIECPLHGYRFGPTGRCVNMRRAAPVRVLQVREADDYIWLAP